MVKKGTCGLCQGGCAVIYTIEDGKIVSGKQTLQIMDKNPNQKEGADCVEREK